MDRPQANNISEQRLQGAAASLGGWFWEMDSDLRFTWVSDSVEEIVGVAAHWHYGKSREELGVPDVAAYVWHEHVAKLEARLPFKNLSTSAVARAGTSGCGRPANLFLMKTMLFSVIEASPSTLQNPRQHANTRRPLGGVSWTRWKSSRMATHCGVATKDW